MPLRPVNSLKTPIVKLKPLLKPVSIVTGILDRAWRFQILSDQLVIPLYDSKVIWTSSAQATTDIQIDTQQDTFSTHVRNAI